MTADGSTDVVLDDRDGFVLFGEQLANSVGIFFRIGMADESEVAISCRPCLWLMTLMPCIVVAASPLRLLLRAPSLT